VTTFLAVMWTGDIQDATSPFVPGTQFMKAVQKAFSDPKISPPGDTIPWEAVWAERVRDNGPIGWGLEARGGRARILQEYLKHK
jgi:hypothetical protein